MSNEHKGNPVSIAALQKERDYLIRRVWSVMAKLCDELKEDLMTDEDLAVWTPVTAHSAVQSKLDTAPAGWAGAQPPTSPEEPDDPMFGNAVFYDSDDGI
jgi:hypothetical protein